MCGCLWGGKATSKGAHKLTCMHSLMHGLVQEACHKSQKGPLILPAAQCVLTEDLNPPTNAGLLSSENVLIQMSGFLCA